ncbi:MAG: hypothetical protein D3910_07950, partial [Candidatus Electrothrix sp. ATG2]|nr:hypothetical protein [Candidatus Electrothrix sp. ATG2]
QTLTLTYSTRRDSDWDFLIIADHPLDREIITKLKDGLYDIELENDEVVAALYGAAGVVFA